jgi:RNA polymerase sigma factor (sigma-70 family)
MPSVSDQTDQSLLDDFVRHGLESAFAELARRHQAMAFAAAYRICGERGEAQDILQQALLVLARRAGDLGDVRCLSAWLHRVVILEAKKARRTAANRRRRETMAYQINELSSSGQAFSQKIAPELDQSLNAMREKDREVLTLHYLEGQTFQAIARSLGGTAEAWQKRSVRALQKLADKLRSRGVAVSTVALGAFFISARAEAGVSASFLETLTRHALEVSAKDAVVTLGKTAILLSMKTGIAVSLASGVLLAYGWGVVTDHIPNKPWDAGTQARVEESSGEERVMRDPRDRGFTLEMVKLAVDEYERATKSDPLAESRLRSLMFSKFCWPPRIIRNSNRQQRRYSAGGRNSMRLRRWFARKKRAIFPIKQGGR